MFYFTNHKAEDCNSFVVIWTWVSLFLSALKPKHSIEQLTNIKTDKDQSDHICLNEMYVWKRWRELRVEEIFSVFANSKI